MGFADGYRVGADVRDRRNARREQAKNRNQELQMKGYNFDDNGNMSVRENSQAQQAEMVAQEAVMRSKALFARMSKYDTANALEEHSLTGDASYLNNDLNSSPEKKQAWAKQGVHMVDNISFDNDGSILQKAGFVPSSYDTPEKQDIIRKSAYKIHDGKDWSIGLANTALAQTGAGTVLGKRRSKPSMENHKQLVELIDGPKSSPYTAEGHKYEKYIMSASEKYDVPPNLIAAVMNQESAGKADAVSPKGASGLMQLMPATAKELGVTDIFDVGQNIDAGVKYLSQQLKTQKGDVKLALAAYNAGPGNVRKYGGIPPFSETQNYVKKITARLNEAESYYGNTADDIYASMLQPEEEQPTRTDGIVPNQPPASKEPTDMYEAFMQHDRNQALANAGKDPSMVDAQSQATLQATQANTANTEAKTSYMPQEMAQKDRELNQKDRAINVQEGQLINKTKELAMEATKPTNKRKELNEAEQVEVGIYEKYGSYDKFMKADLKTGSREYADLYTDMVEMEKLTGMQPSEGQLKRVKDLRVMGTLFKSASKLTKEQTGFVDSTLKSMEKFLNENMTEGEASSAYHSIRNIYIHSMAGTAQTKQEAKRLVKSFGTDTQRRGAVLTQLNTVLNQKIAELDSAMRDMHPVSAKVRLGVDMNKMMETKINLGKTLGYIEAQQKFIDGEGPDPDSRPPLDSFNTKD